MKEAPRSFAQLCADHAVTELEPSELGPICALVDGQGASRVRVLAAGHVRAFATLQRYGNLWGHRDYDNHAWRTVAVDAPIEVGADFVRLPRRTGASLASYLRHPATLIPPARLGHLRALLPRLLTAPNDPVDTWITHLIARRLASPDPHTFYDPIDDRFHIQDLMPTADDLAMWTELTANAAD